jgi:ribonuclease-3
MKNPYRSLEKALGYRFRRKHYLEAALTHRSFRFERTGVEMDNQRLEFLGDAALGLIAAAHFYHRHPDLQEGDLTRWRSRITSRDALARIAGRIELGAHLRLGFGELKSGGHQRPSNLSDALEAVLGAAFLDGHMKAVEKIFNTLFVPDAESLLEEPAMDNPKGALQELAQRSLKISPRYRTISEEGPAHSRQFKVEVLIDGQVAGRGEGQSKQQAEIRAAREALERIQSGSLPAPAPSDGERNC